jgi:hypothetical protein
LAAAAGSISVPALAEDGEEARTRKPMVWLQTTSTIAPTYTNGLDASTPSAMQVAGDIGARVGMGVGHWNDQGYVLPGWAGDMDSLEDGFVASGWIRRETPRPGWGDASVLSFGGSVSLFETTRSGRSLLSTLDVGRRLSLDEGENARMEAQQPVAQLMVGWSEQIMLFEGVFIGPATRVGFGNDRMPWDVGVGLEISSVL